jgi:hypothetical protein
LATSLAQVGAAAMASVGWKATRDLQRGQVMNTGMW